MIQVSPRAARHVTARLTEHDAFAAHAETGLGIDPEQFGSLIGASGS